MMECTMEMSKMQVLIDACDSLFSRRDLPTSQDIQWLKKLLDTMEAVDVGIDEYMSPGDEINGLFCAQGVKNITYIHIHECDSFSIGVFCFPAGGAFPLHDHPTMTVLSKLLYGSVHVNAFDWVKVEKSSSNKIGLAGKVIDRVLNAPTESTVLFPMSGGNIHSFTALTPCAILDILSPPYNDEQGRPSTYFAQMPIPSLPGYAILEEKEVPSDLVVVGAPYLGPPIVTADRSGPLSTLIV